MTAVELCPKELKSFQKPVIDVEATGKRIKFLRESKNLSIKDLQSLFGFEYPQAIYLWESGKTLPSVDNLFTLSKLFEIDISEILVDKNQGSEHKNY